MESLLPGTGSLPPVGAAVAVAPAERPCETLVTSTRGLPPAEQFDFWRDRDGGMLEHLPTARPAAAGFAAEARIARFGAFAMMTVDIAGGHYRRCGTRARRDGIDHWTLTTGRRGRRVLRSGDTVQEMTPGTVHIGSLGTAFETVRSDSSWLHLYVPRDTLAGLAATIDGARLRPVPGPLGDLLRDYLEILSRQLPQVSAAEAPRLAETTRAVLAALLAPTPDRLHGAAAPLRQTQLQRVRSIVRENLGSATLGPARLCRLAGMSRSQLYRLFEPLGGVAAHIQAERLRAARQALADPADRRSIAQIAEAVGLFDCSSFSRMFRRAYGCSPREMRAMALADPASLPGPLQAPARPARTISDLLRGL
jgi:AraC-like DNA-binding protein